MTNINETGLSPVRNKANNYTTEYAIFKEIYNDIDYYQDIQISIYDKIKNKNQKDFTNEINNSKTLSEKILYYLANSQIQLRTFNIKDNKNISGMWISRKDKRIRLRFCNTKIQKEMKDNHKTLSHIIGFMNKTINQTTISIRGMQKIIHNSTRLHGHHKNNNKTIDSEQNIDLLIDTQHYKTHTTQPNTNKANKFNEYMGYKTH